MASPAHPAKHPGANVSDDELERGVGLFGRAMGEQAAAELRQHIESHKFGNRIAQWAAHFAFGTVWGRDVLEPRMRSCAVLGMLVASGDGEALRHHVRIALENGMSEREIEEVVYQAVPVVGFPAAAAASRTIAGILAEIDRAHGGSTAKAPGAADS